MFETVSVISSDPTCKYGNVLFTTLPLKTLFELKTFDWDILNPVRVINLEINNKIKNMHYLISRLRKRVD